MIGAAPGAITCVSGAAFEHMKEQAIYFGRGGAKVEYGQKGITRRFYEPVRQRGQSSYFYKDEEAEWEKQRN